MKILMMPFSLFIGHTLRLLEVAKELRKKGHEIVFASENSPLNLIEKNGFDRIHVKEVDNGIFQKLVKNLKIVDEKNLNQMIASDIACFKKTKPDMVVSDFHVSAAISSETQNIFHASILNAYFTPFLKFNPSVPQNIAFLNFLQKHVPQSISYFWKYLTLSRGMMFQRIRKKHGLQKKGGFLDQLTGNINFIVDLPELFQLKSLPKNHIVSGPLFFKEKKPAPKALQKLPKNKKTIYLTIGSESNAALLKSLIGQIDLQNYNLILTNPHIKIKKPGIISLPFTPALPILEKSDLVICHGGNGTIYQAIATKTPILGIPLNFEQNMNMGVVESAGIGKRLNNTQHADIPSLMEELISNEKYQQRITHFSRLMKNYNAPKAIAKNLEEGKTDK